MFWLQAQTLHLIWEHKCHLSYLGYTSSKNRQVVANGPVPSVLLHFCQLLTQREGASLPSFCWLRRITGWLRFAETSWGHLVQFTLLPFPPRAWWPGPRWDGFWISSGMETVWEIWTMLYQRRARFCCRPTTCIHLPGQIEAGKQCCPKMYWLSLKRSPVKIPAAVLNTGTLAYARSEAFKSHKYPLFLLSNKKTLNQLGKTAN